MCEAYILLLLLGLRAVAWDTAMHQIWYIDCGTPIYAHIAFMDYVPYVCPIFVEDCRFFLQVWPNVTCHMMYRHQKKEPFRYVLNKGPNI